MQRWKRDISSDRRKGSHRFVPHKLTHEERRKIIEVSSSERFADSYPSEIVAKLAESGIYIASEDAFTPEEI
jgi:hypothetical protein